MSTKQSKPNSENDENENNQEIEQEENQLSIGWIRELQSAFSNNINDVKEELKNEWKQDLQRLTSLMESLTQTQTKTPAQTANNQTPSLEEQIETIFQKWGIQKPNGEGGDQKEVKTEPKKTFFKGKSGRLK